LRFLDQDFDGDWRIREWAIRHLCAPHNRRERIALSRWRL
jgi:hypothetical protein